MAVAGTRRDHDEGPVGWGKNRTKTDRTGPMRVKRSLWTDGGGVPVGVTVAGANVNDYKLTQTAYESMPVDRPEPGKPGTEAEQGLCLDADYYREEILELVHEWGYTAHVRPVG